MTTPNVATTVTPNGDHTVAPWNVTRDTGKEIHFLVAAFQGVELGRVLDADGLVGHAEVRIRDFIVLLFDAKELWPDTPSPPRLYVVDIDSIFDRTLASWANGGIKNRVARTPTVPVSPTFNFADEKVRNRVAVVWNQSTSWEPAGIGTQGVPIP